MLAFNFSQQLLQKVALNLARSWKLRFTHGCSALARFELRNLSRQKSAGCCCAARETNSRAGFKAHVAAASATANVGVRTTAFTSVDAVSTVGLLLLLLMTEVVRLHQQRC